MKYGKFFIGCAFVFMLMSLASCNDNESYSNLLKEEEKATNWFLADKKICLEIPKDSVFEVGPNAPFYKMDEDGYLYMQVVSVPEKRQLPEKDSRIYFRYKRMNIKNLYVNGIENWSGNLDNLEIVSSSFWFQNYQFNESRTYGTGIQTPVSYLGYDSEVNLVLRSYYGFADDQSSCIPYYITIRYFKAEY